MSIVEVLKEQSGSRKGRDDTSAISEVELSKNSSIRLFSQKEFSEIIAYAGAFQELDERKKAVSRPALVESLQQFDDGISLSVLYRIANDMSIPNEYIDKVIAIRNGPSLEEQLKAITELGALPSVTSITKDYEKTLLTALQTYMPFDKFAIYNYHNDFYDTSSLGVFVINEVKETSKFLFFKKEKTIKNSTCLANIKIDSDKEKYRSGFGLTIDLHDPRFLLACGDSLKRLNEKFNDQMHYNTIKYHYLPQ